MTLLEDTRNAGVRLLVIGFTLLLAGWIIPGAGIVGFVFMFAGVVAAGAAQMVLAFLQRRWFWPVYILSGFLVMPQWLFTWMRLRQEEPSLVLGTVTLVVPLVLIGWWMLGEFIGRLLYGAEPAKPRRSWREQLQEMRSMLNQGETAGLPKRLADTPRPPSPPPLRLDAALTLDQLFTLLRRHGSKTPELRRLPTEAEIADMEAALGVRFTPEYRRYLREVSHLVLGDYVLGTITDAQAPTHLPRLIEAARHRGLPEPLLPFCEANGDYFCFNARGEIEYWSAVSATNERWPRFADWMRQAWLRDALAETA